MGELSNTEAKLKKALFIKKITCSEVTFDKDLSSVETNQLIFIARRLFGFYMAQGIIEGSLQTFLGFLNVTLFS